MSPLRWRATAGWRDELGKAGIVIETYNAALLHEPWEVENKSGKPFQVFTPFWKTMRGLEVDQAPSRAAHACALPKPEAIGWKAGSCCHATPTGRKTFDWTPGETVGPSRRSTLSWTR